MIKRKWIHEEFNHSNIYYRHMLNDDGSKLGYVMYIRMNKRVRHVKEFPFKTIMRTEQFIEEVLDFERNREPYKVILINSDLKPPYVKKPKELKGLKMIKSFKIDTVSKTMQVFVRQNDVYIKDNDYVTTTRTEYQTSHGDITGIKTLWYVGAGWYKLPNMVDSKTRPRREDFIHACARDLCINKDNSANLKWEIMYNEIVNILDKEMID